MSTQPTTRQQLYDRIRETSKDEFVLEEMIRLGFWPKGGDQPNDPAEEIRRKGELERKLSELTKENRRLGNVEQLKKEARRKRMKESRERQKANKEARIQAKKDRAAAWQERKQHEISYLGEGVSAGLNHQESDAEKLKAAGLPVFNTAEELATAMQITVGELRFLAYARKTSRISHYKRFAIPKKTGGQRNISAPMPRLKRAQEWVLTNLLELVSLHEAAHGFVKGKSIVSNAAPHVGAEVVVNADLKDFFPTVTYARIKGLFRKLGYSESIATILGLICSEPAIQEVILDGHTYHVARSERFLPQGAPTSPAITNIICRGLDARLTHMADALGMTYTRYADDLTLSGSGEATENVGKALNRLRHVVKDEGFYVHPEKTRILRKGRRQEVTGLIVNEKVNVSRKQLKNFRATLYQIEKDGPAGKRWGNTDDVIAAISGFANFVAMVDAEKGAEFQAQVQQIIKKHGRGEVTTLTRNRWEDRTPETSTETPENPTDETARAAQVMNQSETPGDAFPMLPPEDENKPWWKIW